MTTAGVGLCSPAGSLPRVRVDVESGRSGQTSRCGVDKGYEVGKYDGKDAERSREWRECEDQGDGSGPCQQACHEGAGNHWHGTGSGRGVLEVKEHFFNPCAVTSGGVH